MEGFIDYLGLIQDSVPEMHLMTIVNDLFESNVVFLYSQCVIDSIGLMGAQTC